MSTPTPPIPRLRKLLLKFYQENDPVVLQQGFDISGLVDFTAEKGIDVVNRMLFKKYGKAIDVNADLGTAKQNFNRMSQALTTSTVIVKKEHEFRQKLFVFFSKHDPSMTQPGKAKQMETLVKFAMLNGLPKLSDKLRTRYGAPIEGADQVNDEEEMVINVDEGQFDSSNQNLFNLDVDRLRADLEVFYTEMEDDEQLEVLDETTNWACEIGIEEFDKKLQQVYGKSLNQFNEEIGKELHYNRKEEVKHEPEPVKEEIVQTREIPPVQDEGFDIVRETVVVPGVEKDFDEMTDVELIAELRAFYEKNDPDNLANLEKVLAVARKMGRDALNDNLYQIYNDHLHPIDETKVIEKRVERQIPPVEREIPPVKREIPPIKNDQPITMPKQRQMPSFSPPAGGVGIGGADLMAEMANKQLNKPKVDVEEEMRKRKEREEEERLAKMPEFMRKALQTKKNNQEGKSKVWDPVTRKYVTVNILIDVCKNYKLDPMTGLCAKCEFAVGDHFYGYKKKGY